MHPNHPAFSQRILLLALSSRPRIHPKTSGDLDLPVIEQESLGQCLSLLFYISLTLDAMIKLAKVFLYSWRFESQKNNAMVTLSPGRGCIPVGIPTRKSTRHQTKGTVPKRKPSSSKHQFSGVLPLLVVSRVYV